MNKKEYINLSIPLVIGILATLILYVFVDNAIIINNFDIISSNYINFVSVLVGFLITTITMIIGFFDKKIIKAIIATNKQKVLFANWFATIITGICSILHSFYIVAIFDNSTNTINKNPFTIILFLTLLFIGYLVCSLIYFFGIASFVMKENIEHKEVEEISKNNIKFPKEI